MPFIIQKWMFNIFLPRGAAHQPNVHHDQLWAQEIVESGNRSIFTEILHPNVEARGIVILAHPYRSEARLFFQQNGLAEWYLRIGWLVVIFDFNGFGNSPFSGFDFHCDIIPLVKKWKSQLPDLPIVLHGISFGAGQAILACEQPQHQIDALIVENCLDSPLSYFRKRKPSLYRFWKTINLLRQKPAPDYVSAISRSANCPPTLFIYSTEDTLTPLSMGQKLLRAMPVPAEMIVCKGKHLASFSADHTYYTRQLGRFLANCRQQKA